MKDNQLKNLVGRQFGELIVLKRNPVNSKSGNARWDCKCSCGNIATVIGSKLRNGTTKSCGCARKSKIAQGFSKTRIYIIWSLMKKRCYRNENENFKHYGGRGIEVCDEWKKDFIAFRSWALSNGYADNLSIDRIDVNGNYEPKNCRWVDTKTQANNRRNNRIIIYLNNEYTVSEFADFLKVSYWTVRNQLKLGWPIEKIVQKARA